MTMTEIAAMAEQYARNEIKQHNVPEMMHYEISLEKGIWLAQRLGADLEIVKIGISFMDLKLGQAFKENRIPDHVKMSIESAKQFLAQHNVDPVAQSNIINCIEAHHGNLPFETLEAEICANADCYRFLHPKGIFFYFTVLGRRLGNFKDALTQVENKMDEKYKIVSLQIVKDELFPVYDSMKKYFQWSK